MKSLKAVIAVFAIILVITIALWKRPNSALPMVAVINLMSHPALDQVEGNAIRILAESGYVDGETIQLIRRNANGQSQLASAIAQEVVSLSPRVTIAITTPMAQAMVKNATTPVVFAAVTDPIGAGLVDSLTKTPPLVSGTSDAWPYKDQLALIREISPRAKRLGVLFNPGEAASQYGIARIRDLAPQFGFEVIEGAVSSTNEVYSVAQSIIGKCDALFLSSDNTVIGGMAAAFRVAVEARKPLFVGDSGTVEKGGLATVSVGYDYLGEETGRLAVAFLKGETSLPVVVAGGNEIYVNLKAAEMMGVEIPTSVIERATQVYQSIGK